MPTQQEILIAAFRQEMEDMFSAMETRFYLNHGTPYDDQGTQFVDDGVPYLTTDEVLTIIPVSMRKDYRTVNVMGVDYWFIGGVLVPKVASMAIADNSVTLAKLVNIATASFVGRKTAGPGSPEVLSVADVKTLLGLTGVVFSNFITVMNGYSLVADTEIAKIHAAGSDNQDLSGYVASVAGSRLITESEAGLISAMNPPIRINLASASTVAGRVLLAVDGVNYPAGWILTASEYDLIITHNLGKEISRVTIFEANATGKQMLIGSVAFAGITGALDNNSFVILGLAPKEVDLIIHLNFA